MSSLPRDPADGRSRYTHQAYDVTYGGKSIESGPAGFGKRLSATYQANFQIPIDAADTDPQIFTLPPFVYCNKLVVAKGAGGSAVASLTLGASTVLGAAVPLVQSASDIALAARIPAINADQKITVQVTTPGTGIAMLILKCDIVVTAWK